MRLFGGAHGAEQKEQDRERDDQARKLDGLEASQQDRQDRVEEMLSDSTTRVSAEYRAQVRATSGKATYGKR